MIEKEIIKTEVTENASEEELQSDSGVYAMARAVLYSVHDTTEPSDDDELNDDENGEYPGTENGDTGSDSNTTPDGEQGNAGNGDTESGANTTPEGEHEVPDNDDKISTTTTTIPGNGKHCCACTCDMGCCKKTTPNGEHCCACDCDTGCCKKTTPVDEHHPPINNDISGTTTTTIPCDGEHCCACNCDTECCKKKTQNGEHCCACDCDTGCCKKTTPVDEHHPPVNNDIGGTTTTTIVTPPSGVLVESITVTPSTITLKLGTTYELPVLPNTFTGVNGAEPLSNLTASIVPANATEKKVSWISFDSDIITVETGWYNGEIYQTLKAVGNGIAKLYAYDWNENGKRGECTVYVGGAPVTGITLDCTYKTMQINESDYIFESVLPSNALNKKVIWSSSNSLIAEVDAVGKVTAKTSGTAVITAKTKEGGYTATCTIYVVSRVIIEKYPDANHNRIVFPNGKIWNCINFDIINDYTLKENDYESQRFFDNTYETKVIDPNQIPRYDEPMKEYSDEEIKLIYLIDPHGLAAYVHEYAKNLPEPGDDPETMLGKILDYKDRIFSLLFNRSPDYYARTIDGVWYETSDRHGLIELMSESEFLFGTHTIYDGFTLREFVTVAIDIISMVIQCPAIAQFKNVVNIISKVIEYFSLVRSVATSVLDADFNGLVTAIVDGVVGEEDLEESFIIPAEYKTQNYTVSWAFKLHSFSSDLGSLADTFNNGPHFYKEVFTQCQNDTGFDVYIRMSDNNLVSISDIKNIIE